jgi:hypothetical protein
MYQMHGGRMMSDETSNTDIAALSASIVAVAVSLFVAPGSFNILNLVVSVTLAAVIVGYVWPRIRSKRQSLAIAAAMGLAMLPAIGFLDEAIRSPNPLHFLAGTYEWDCKIDPCKSDGDDKSRVPARDLAVGWLLTLVASFLVDRVTQKRRHS